MKTLQEDSEEYKMIILQQQNSRNHIEELQTMRPDELGLLQNKLLTYL